MTMPPDISPDGVPGDDGDNEVADRLVEVRSAVADAARTSGRQPADVTIVAISKTRDARGVRAAARMGQRHFGESRAQELRDKVGHAVLTPWDDIVWHFVGRLQTNKVKFVVGDCALVHSVDRWDVAAALDSRARFAGTSQRVLVQINTDDDPGKAGLTPQALPGFLARMAPLDHVRVDGLMTIPALDGDPARAFARLRALRDDIGHDHPSVRHLSMGMSRDYVAAIREGATIVRVGEAIFGPRNT